MLFIDMGSSRPGGPGPPAFAEAGWRLLEDTFLIPVSTSPKSGQGRAPLCQLAQDIASSKHLTDICWQTGIIVRFGWNKILDCPLLAQEGGDCSVCAGGCGCGVPVLDEVCPTVNALPAVHGDPGESHIPPASRAGPGQDGTA